MDLFDLSHTLARDLFDARPWSVLDRLESFLWDLGPRLGSAYDQIAPGVWVGRGTSVDAQVTFQAPVIVGRDGQIRPGAFLRPGTLAGDRCVLGHASEFKNCVLFDDCQAPHFNYVGDSVLGWNVHLGGGAIASNYKAGGGEIHLEWDGERVFTGRTKLGVLVGDGADVGAQAVMNPGTVLGRGVTIYPLVAVRGTVPAGMIVKTADPTTWVVRRPTGR